MNFTYVQNGSWLIPLSIMLFIRIKNINIVRAGANGSPHLADAHVKQQHMKTTNWFINIHLDSLCDSVAGPTWHKVNVPVSSQDAGRAILVDLSMSMLATDMTPNRLTQAKYKLTDLLDNFKEGKTGLVAYAGDAFVLSPLTEDHQMLLHLIPVYVQTLCRLQVPTLWRLSRKVWKLLNKVVIKKVI